MSWTKAEAEGRRSAWVHALQEVARVCGTDSVTYKALGSAAWGRLHEGESCPDEKVGHVFLGLGYAMGLRSAALDAARALGNKREIQELERIHNHIPVRFGGHKPDR